MKRTFNKKIQAGLKGLTKLLTEQVNKDRKKGQPKIKVDVAVFEDQGFRISEISFTRNVPGLGTLGESYERVNPDNLGFLLAAEDYVLKYHIKPFRPEGWFADLDERADAQFRLLELLNRPKLDINRQG
jgi:hypothetical protein